MTVFSLKVVLYHDPVDSNVFISDDEGENWKRVPNVPEGEAMMIIDHPTNNRYVSPVLLTQTPLLLI